MTRILVALLATLIVGNECFGQSANPNSSPTEVQGVSQEERHALVALYEATDGSHWTNHDGWLGAPGTERKWFGVTCESRVKNIIIVTDLGLSRNNLRGTIPGEARHLTHLKWLYLFGNNLSGMLPQPWIRRWLAGELAISVESPLLTDVSEIDFEVSASAVLCERHRMILRSNSSIVLFTERCRNAPAGDRSTFCEVKEGHVSSTGFAALGRLLEKNEFFALRHSYYRNITEGTFKSTRVTRNGRRYEGRGL